MDLVEQFPIIVLIIINGIALLFVFRDYLRTKNRILILMIMSLIFLLLSSFMHYQLVASNFSHGAVGNVEEMFFLVFGFSFSNLFITVSVYFLILFFEAFRQGTRFTRRNVALAITTAILFTLTLLNLLYLRLVFEDYPNLLQVQNGTEPLELGIPKIGASVFLVSVLLMIISLIFLITIIIIFVKEVRRSLNAINNPNMRPNAMRMKWSVYILVTGAFLSGVGNTQHNSSFGYVMVAVFIVGLAGLMISIHKGGLFFLQGDDLKRLIVINSAGSPIYSYRFRSFSSKPNQSLIEEENQDVLFSGALTSISMLLGEFTGSNQKVTEISLENLVMIVETFPSGSSVVLMVEVSTRFIREAFDRFTPLVKELVESVKFGQALSTEQAKTVNQIVENIFGQSYMMLQE